MREQHQQSGPGKIRKWSQTEEAGPWVRNPEDDDNDKGKRKATGALSPPDENSAKREATGLKTPRK